MLTGYTNFLPKISLEPAPSSTSLEPTTSSSPPLSHRTIVPDPGRALHTHCHLPRPWADDAIDHTGIVPKPMTPLTHTVVSKQHRPPYAILEPATPSFSSSPWRPRAHDAIDPAPLLSLWCCQPRAVPWPMMSSTPRRPWARNAIFLPEPGTPSTPWRPRARDVVDPIPSPSTQHYIVYFSMSFWTYISWIWYATLSHCFDMLPCFNMLHITILLLFCHIALICYTLLLFCYILIYMNAYYIAQWRKWAKWDECGNMDQHYCTIKISASNIM
jgi:hypothetical protein